MNQFTQRISRLVRPANGQPEADILAKARPNQGNKELGLFLAVGAAILANLMFCWSLSHPFQ